MAWAKLSTTNGNGTSNNLTTGTITASKFNKLLIYNDSGIVGGEDTQITFNNDTGSNYARRYNFNGTSEGTQVSQSSIKNLLDGDVNHDGFAIAYFVNISAQEKLVISWHIGNSSSGAGTAPDRAEQVYKWANTSAQITEVDLNTSGSTNWTSNTNLTVLGTD